MGKVISDEDIKLNVIINGNEAQKKLFELEKGTRKLNEETAALKLEKKRLEAQNKTETEDYKRITAKIKENNAAIRANKTEMSALQKEIGITGLTMKQLTDRAHILKMTLRNLIPGSEAHSRYTKELNDINSRLGELSGKAKQAKISIGSIADGFNRYAALGATIVAMLTGVVLSAQKFLDINGKLADAQADVMKTTGMTKDEVDELTKSFGLLKTRTQRIDLLGIAEQGGRIGILKEDIGEFVETMNMAAVALGDSFSGGAEEVAEKLGKLKFLFQETKNMGVEQAYMAIGSAINGLGAEGVASESSIADFATRIGSLTDVLKPTIAQTLALGAAFEESGIESEVSARAYNIFMKQASTESAKFAKVMNLTQKQVEAMINKDPLDFMLQFAKGMRGMDATETAKTLDYLGINADGANKVIGAMGNNFDRFNVLIKDSNTLFTEGTSLINEYNVKNENLAATLEKIKKVVIGWFSSETLNDWLITAAEGFGKLIGATDDADGAGQRWRNTLAFTAKMIAVVTAALVTNVAWQKLTALWTARNVEANLLYTIAARARAFADGVATVAQLAFSAATSLLTGNIKAATMSFRMMTAAMMTTPWGFILGAIAAIVVAYKAFSDEVDRATIIQQTLNDVHTDATKAIAKEKNELELLAKIASDEAVSKEKRQKAIERLNEIIPDYIGNLTLENIKTAEGIAILKKYTDELYRNARAKSVQKKFDELSDKKVELEGKTSKDYEGTGQKISNFIFGETDAVKDRADVEKRVLETFRKMGWTRIHKETGVELIKDKKEFDRWVENWMRTLNLDEKEKDIADVEAQMKALEPELKQNAISGPKEGDTKVEGGVTYQFTNGKWVKIKSKYTVPTGDEKDGKKKKYDDSYLEEERKAREELYQLQILHQERMISLMEDGYEKDLALEKLNTQKKIHEYELQNSNILVLQAKLDKELEEAIKAGDTKKVASIKNQQKLLNAKIVENNRLICDEEEQQNIRLGIIEEKGAKRAIEKADEKFKFEKTAREAKFNEELAQITSVEDAKQKLKGTLSKRELSQIKSLDDAKKALQEQFNQQELKTQTEYLTGLLAKLDQIINAKEFEGIDLDLLTPEMREKFKLQIEEAKKLRGELMLAMKRGDMTDEQKNQDDKEHFANLNGGADILGYTAEEWADAYARLDTFWGKMAAGVMVATALQNAWAKYNQFVEAGENAAMRNYEQRTETKKRQLQRFLDTGVISQAQYSKSVERLDRQVERKKAELEYKQAKRRKTMSIVDTIVNTAVAIMQAYAQLGPIGGTIAAVLIGTLGALQIATIQKQPLPARGYEEGLYPEYVKREQDGKVFKSRYGGKTKSGVVSRPTYFLAGENNKPEMIIDNKAWSKMSPKLREALLREIRGVKGFENGYYQDGVLHTGPKKPDSDVPAGGGESRLLERVLDVLEQNTEVMNDIRQNGVRARVSNRDTESMKNIKEGIKDYEDLMDKSKK